MSKDINEQYEIWRKSPTQTNMKSVIDSMSSDIDRAIQTSGGKPDALSRGYAKGVLVNAARTFDPAANSQFRSWAQTQFKRLVRPIRGFKFTLKIPELRARESAKVRSLIDEMQAESGFEPSDAVIADKLSMPMSHVESARRGTAPEVMGEEIWASKESVDNTALINDMVYYSLAPRDQTIMEYAFGHNGVKPLPSNEIARKVGVTESAISQRVGKIRDMMMRAEEGL